MKKRSIIIFSILILGLILFLTLRPEKDIELDTPEGEVELNIPEESDESTITFSNLHEKENFNAIHEANISTEERLEKSLNIYLNHVFVDVGYDWDGTIFVPIRSISESLNWAVRWIPERQMIQLAKENEEYYVAVVNLFGKAYIDIDTLEYSINLDTVFVSEGRMDIGTSNAIPWRHLDQKPKSLNFYINDMLMTKYAYEHENEIYVPTKILATSLGKVFRYNAEEGSVSIDGVEIDAILMDGIPYTNLASFEKVADLSPYHIRYDDLEKVKEGAVPVYKGTDTKKVALTFDDYIDEEVFPLLDVLDAHHVKGTFFIIGNTIDRNKDVLREIYRRGHIIANHTWEHLNNHSITEDEFRAQLISTQLVIQENIGILPNYYRPPGGFYNAKMLRIAKEVGLQTIMWSLNSNDALFDSKPAHIKETVLKGLANGSIIVMHTKRNSTIEALPEIIKRAKEKGYAFVTIDELINERSAMNETE
ncbi:polysaccharide deacetylase family protein [Alkaliphilus oremlandii]|uniref:Polysaccharide deacetylase n=1 Tax=Alkaliphilus oremlandii (strain OhILAs) TaxID=350688 RepID=A8MKL5_ALKOO|nr:polysaccharide deacetylase family protein [Alkaliphilus oremlandii]ABW20347.1 polysaccharide deacetylase [Alkaliphilus oremlandii OhILAs]